MRKIMIFIMLMMGIMVLPTTAQSENFDCSTNGVNFQIDVWYNEYIGSRGEFETDQALEAAAEFAANVQELTEACGFVATTTEAVDAEQTGIGTEDEPFVVLAPAVIGDTTITITNDIRPANQTLVDAGVNDASNVTEPDELFLVFLQVDCRQGSSGGCNISDRAFRLIGDLGRVYEPTLDQYNLYLPGSVPIVGGSSRTGGIPFRIDSADTNLRLIYYPDANPLEVNAEAYYLIAQGTADSFEITSTTAELLIRNRPSSGGAPLGAFRTGQVGIASGRTADGSWIFVEAPEGTGWVSADFVDSEMDLESLPVLEPDDE